MTTFQQEYDPDITVFGFRRVGLQGEVLSEDSPTDVIRLYESEEMQQVYEKILVDNQLSCLWAQVVKRSIVDFECDYSPFYRVFKGEDLLQNLSFLDRASSVLFVPNIYHSYFINVEGLTHKKVTVSYLNSHIVVHEKILEYMEKWRITSGKADQMIVGAFNRALKALMQNKFSHPLYSSAETGEILSFLSTGIRYDYLKKIDIDWHQKRLGLCIWLLKRRQIVCLKFVLFICRILNLIKKMIRYEGWMHIRKETNV